MNATAQIPQRARQQERDKLVRDIVTPEGIPLRFRLAPATDRAAAFAIDCFLQLAVLVAIMLAISLAAGGDSKSSWLTPLGVLLAFLIVNFYFTFFEVRWQGSTPGKRRIGLRVIDARGGQLETSAVLARNLARELEVWTPLRLLAARGVMWPDAPGWANVIAIVWSLVFLLLPLFNKDKLRVGDLIGGTRVVVQPKPILLPDLAQRPASFTFTEQQLAVYGIYELQVLEGLLRQDESSLGHWDAVSAVAQKVRDKLGYTEPIANERQFLADFYAALRANLEQKLLFGHRREDKFSKK